MGLDMYLYKRMYTKNWEHMDKAEKHTVTVKLGGKIRKDVKPERIAYVTEEVMYWRKANAIHKWFVDNVQEGKDDCGEYSVSREKLSTLLELCNRVLAGSKLVDGDVVNGYTFDKDATGTLVRKPMMEKGKYIEDDSVARELLPCTDGFFFGSTAYDQYYYEDIKATADALTGLLEEPVVDGVYVRYIYSSSW